MQLSNANKRFEKNIFIKHFFLRNLTFFIYIECKYECKNTQKKQIKILMKLNIAYWLD